MKKNFHSLTHNIKSAKKMHIISNFEEQPKILFDEPDL